MAGDGVWVVTGASRGIGAAIARLAVEAGQKVALISRGESVMELAQSLGESAAGFQCDVADPDSVTETVDAIVARFGRVEVQRERRPLGTRRGQSRGVQLRARIRRRPTLSAL